MLLRKQIGILGTSLGLIKASAKDSADQFQRWQTEIGKVHGYSMVSECISGDINSNLLKLFPLTAPVRTKYLFLPTNSSEWTAYFDNGVLGTDAVGLMSVMAQKLSTLTIRVTCSPNTMPSKVFSETRGSYGANILEVYNSQGVRRVIYCANDGGKWKFGQSGEPFDFENMPQYLTRRISEKFTEEMLRNYLSNLAVDALDDSAYECEDMSGILISRKGNSLVNKKIELSDILNNLNE
jgi:hypothetical protein